MPGLIIGGKEEEVPGLKIVNYRDAPELKLKPAEDMRSRKTRWIRSICWHNTKNIETNVKPGVGPDTNLGERIAKLWATDGRNAGAHLSVDWCKTICCHADLLLDATYHAGSLNEVSIGGEIYEDSQGFVYEAQMETVVLLTEWLCKRFGIQRQIPSNKGTVTRIVSGGSDCVGVVGHRHNYAGKPNDPGQDIFDLLAKAGFRQFDFDAEEDLDWWEAEQKKLGLESDGIPGPATCDALRQAGYPYGLWAEKQ